MAETFFGRPNVRNERIERFVSQGFELAEMNVWWAEEHEDAVADWLRGRQEAEAADEDEGQGEKEEQEDKT